MKKNDCSIIRDLMPLVIDRAASDESRQAVEEHVSACQECGRQYEAMKADLPDGDRSAYEQEQKQFIEALRAVRKMRLRRRLTAAALAAVLCCLAAFGGLIAYDRLVNRKSVQVGNDKYALSLAKLRDGRIVVTADTFGIDFDTMTNVDERMEDGETVLYMYFGAAPIHAFDSAPLVVDAKWCLSILEAGTEQNLDEIRQGKPDDYKTLWVKGEVIPAASEEMEAFIALRDQMDDWIKNSKTAHDGKGYIQQRSEYYILREELQQAGEAVPEWK